MDKTRKYILASGSPRRIEMMRAHHIEPLIMPASIEENIPPNHDMCEAVMFLALKKAKAVENEYLSAYTKANINKSENVNADLEAKSKSEFTLEISSHIDDVHLPDAVESCSDTAIILAADTIVYKNEIMGKPKNREDAFRMLSALRNDVHYVVTGCALVEAGLQNARVFAEVTKVFVKDFSDDELNAYLDTDEPYDKAGGYAIQGAFAAYIDHIEGDYDNVVGFPWERIECEMSALLTGQPK